MAQNGQQLARDGACTPSRPMNATTFEFDAPDGHRIHVRAWTPEAEPRATVQIVHGMAEHSGRYAPLAEKLVGRGFAVYASDHRGHGGSIPLGEEPGHLGEDGFVHAARVVATLARRIEKKHPAVPRVLFGHSFGSFVVQHLLYSEPSLADAVVLSGTSGKPPPHAALGPSLARIERQRLGPRGKSPIIDALTFRDFNRRFKPNRTDFDWISSDPAQVDAYAADPLCGFMLSVQSWLDLFEALPTLTASENLARIPKDLPIYIFAGADDPVGEHGRGVRKLAKAYRKAGLQRVDVRLYDGGRHEMLRETNADEVTAELIAWLERAISTSR